MRTVRRLAFGVLASLIVALTLVGPVGAAGHGFHLTLPEWAFTSGECLAFDVGGACRLVSLSADGTVQSTIGGTGAYHADLVVDSSPGGTCNIVDEHDTFAFASGTMFVTSHHEDCRVHGNRIFTQFTITGGTGEFAGATGGGLEFGNSGAPITYNGQLDR